ncbi:hypothetical protein LEP1GSC017_0713 [Leptospira meyeri serovar Hardjo str. Went 5]|nr:hypothetical protein LEP1GSC017_0713 [Leptospira meyeri serovar Hardjo str. Went 5]
MISQNRSLKTSQLFEIRILLRLFDLRSDPRSEDFKYLFL